MLKRAHSEPAEVLLDNDDDPSEVDILDDKKHQRNARKRRRKQASKRRKQDAPTFDNPTDALITPSGTASLVQLHAQERHIEVSCAATTSAEGLRPGMDLLEQPQPSVINPPASHAATAAEGQAPGAAAAETWARPSGPTSYRDMSSSLSVLSNVLTRRLIGVDEIAALPGPAPLPPSCQRPLLLPPPGLSYSPAPTQPHIPAPSSPLLQRKRPVMQPHPLAQLDWSAEARVVNNALAAASRSTHSGASTATEPSRAGQATASALAVGLPGAQSGSLLSHPQQQRQGVASGSGSEGAVAGAVAAVAAAAKARTLDESQPAAAASVPLNKGIAAFLMHHPGAGLAKKTRFVGEELQAFAVVVTNRGGAAGPLSSNLPLQDQADCQEAEAAAATEGTEAVAVPSRRRRIAYIHGNYQGYYGYRLTSDSREQLSDPRFSFFDPAWFGGKRVVDVGCNEGLVSIGVAAKFGAASVLGIDIDPILVGKARAALASHKRRLSDMSDNLAPQSDTGDCPAVALEALSRVRFIRGDVGRGDCGVAAGAADVVMVLSVTKWIHFHVGDHGLKAFFWRVNNMLSPGGHLVLEPQPWRSYKAAIKKQDMTGVPFRDLARLRFRPEDFREYLRGQLGLELVQETLPTAAKGFDRHLIVLRKPGPGSEMAALGATAAAAMELQLEQAVAGTGTEEVVA